jgi:homoserine O-acetyltransferase/O-succinyltransferase
MLRKKKFGSTNKSFEIGNIVDLFTKSKLILSSGAKYQNIPASYQTYGKLNKKKTNAILLCHPLSGDQYAAGKHPVTDKKGWWDHIIGPGKTIDTRKYFVICSNALGGCMGTFGPNCLNPETKQNYNLDFPIITISDMVKLQYELICNYFEIEKLFAVIGGSMGGMLALEWASKYPQKIHCAIPIATAARHSAQNIAFHEIGRQAIMADPNWQNGDYFAKKTFPTKGLALARMAAHVTYLSEQSLAEKFGRKLQNKKNISYGFDVDFEIESYLHYQGIKFVDRFDANSYLYLSRAMDYFDLEEKYEGNLSNAFSHSEDVRFCVISFSDDWLFPTIESKKITQALNILGINVSFLELPSNRGHDSFLIRNLEFEKTLAGFLDGVNKQLNIF